LEVIQPPKIGGGEESARSGAYKGGRAGSNTTFKNGGGDNVPLKIPANFLPKLEEKPLTNTTYCVIFVFTHNIV
jgi:hypothetical protein